VGKRRREDKAASRHAFGGDWTTTKLDVLTKYLASYTTALRDKPSKDHPFTKGYIDAFAGSGYRDARREDEAGKLSQALLFPELAEPEPQAFLDGSTRLALKTEPRFDRYVFIERSVERCAQLETLRRCQQIMFTSAIGPDSMAGWTTTNRALPRSSRRFVA
jgi:three-Cys-motif partner protein